MSLSSGALPLNTIDNTSEILNASLERNAPNMTFKAAPGSESDTVGLGLLTSARIFTTHTSLLSQNSIKDPVCVSDSLSIPIVIPNDLRPISSIRSTAPPAILLENSAGAGPLNQIRMYTSSGPGMYPEPPSLPSAHPSLHPVVSLTRTTAASERGGHTTIHRNPGAKADGPPSADGVLAQALYGSFYPRETLFELRRERLRNRALVRRDLARSLESFVQKQSSIESSVYVPTTKDIADIEKREGVTIFPRSVVNSGPMLSTSQGLDVEDTLDYGTIQSAQKRTALLEKEAQTHGWALARTEFEQAFPSAARAVTDPVSLKVLEDSLQQGKMVNIDVMGTESTVNTVFGPGVERAVGSANSNPSTISHLPRNDVAFASTTTYTAPTSLLSSASRSSTAHSIIVPSPNINIEYDERSPEAETLKAFIGSPSSSTSSRSAFAARDWASFDQSSMEYSAQSWELPIFADYDPVLSSYTSRMDSLISPFRPSTATLEGNLAREQYNCITNFISTQNDSSENTNGSLSKSQRRDRSKNRTNINQSSLPPMEEEDLAQFGILALLSRTGVTLPALRRFYESLTISSIMAQRALRSYETEAGNVGGEKEVTKNDDVILRHRQTRVMELRAQLSQFGSILVSAVKAALALLHPNSFATPPTSNARGIPPFYLPDTPEKALEVLSHMERSSFDTKSLLRSRVCIVDNLILFGFYTTSSTSSKKFLSWAEIQTSMEVDKNKNTRTGLLHSTPPSASSLQHYLMIPLTTRNIAHSRSHEKDSPSLFDIYLAAAKGGEQNTIPKSKEWDFTHAFTRSIGSFVSNTDKSHTLGIPDLSGLSLLSSIDIPKLSMEGYSAHTSSSATASTSGRFHTQEEEEKERRIIANLGIPRDLIEELTAEHILRHTVHRETNVELESNCAVAMNLPEALQHHIARDAYGRSVISRHFSRSSTKTSIRVAVDCDEENDPDADLLSLSSFAMYTPHGAGMRSVGLSLVSLPTPGETANSELPLSLRKLQAKTERGKGQNDQDHTTAPSSSLIARGPSMDTTIRQLALLARGMVGMGTNAGIAQSQSSHNDSFNLARISVGSSSTPSSSFLAFSDAYSHSSLVMARTTRQVGVFQTTLSALPEVEEMQDQREKSKRRDYIGRIHASSIHGSITLQARVETPVATLHAEPHPMYPEELALLLTDGRVLVWDVEHATELSSRSTKRFRGAEGRLLAPISTGSLGASSGIFSGDGNGKQENEYHNDDGYQYYHRSSIPVSSRMRGKRRLNSASSISSSSSTWRDTMLVDEWWIGDFDRREALHKYMSGGNMRDFDDDEEDAEEEEKGGRKKDKDDQEYEYERANTFEEELSLYQEENETPQSAAFRHAVAASTDPRVSKLARSLLDSDDDENIREYNGFGTHAEKKQKEVSRTTKKVRFLDEPISTSIPSVFLRSRNIEDDDDEDRDFLRNATQRRSSGAVASTSRHSSSKDDSDSDENLDEEARETRRQQKLRKQYIEKYRGRSLVQGRTSSSAKLSSFWPVRGSNLSVGALRQVLRGQTGKLNSLLRPFSRKEISSSRYSAIFDESDPREGTFSAKARLSGNTHFPAPRRGFSHHRPLKGRVRPPFPVWGTLTYAAHPRTILAATPHAVFRLDLRSPEAISTAHSARASAFGQGYSSYTPGLGAGWSASSRLPLALEHRDERIFALTHNTGTGRGMYERYDLGAGSHLFAVSTATAVVMIDERRPEKVVIRWEIPGLPVPKHTLRGFTRQLPNNEGLVAPELRQLTFIHASGGSSLVTAARPVIVEGKMRKVDAAGMTEKETMSFSSYVLRVEDLRREREVGLGGKSCSGEENHDNHESCESRREEEMADEEAFWGGKGTNLGASITPRHFILGASLRDDKAFLFEFGSLSQATQTQLQGQSDSEQGKNTKKHITRKDIVHAGFAAFGAPIPLMDLPPPGTYLYDSALESKVSTSTSLGSTSNSLSAAVRRKRSTQSANQLANAKTKTKRSGKGLSNSASSTMTFSRRSASSILSTTGGSNANKAEVSSMFPREFPKVPKTMMAGAGTNDPYRPDAPMAWVQARDLVGRTPSVLFSSAEWANWCRLYHVPLHYRASILKDWFLEAMNIFRQTQARSRETTKRTSSSYLLSTSDVSGVLNTSSTPNISSTSSHNFSPHNVLTEAFAGNFLTSLRRAGFSLKPSPLASARYKKRAIKHANLQHTTKNIKGTTKHFAGLAESHRASVDELISPNTLAQPALFSGMTLSLFRPRISTSRRTDVLGVYPTLDVHHLVQIKVTGSGAVAAQPFSWFPLLRALAPPISEEHFNKVQEKARKIADENNAQRRKLIYETILRKDVLQAINRTGEHTFEKIIDIVRAQMSDVVCQGTCEDNTKSAMDTNNDSNSNDKNDTDNSNNISSSSSIFTKPVLEILSSLRGENDVDGNIDTTIHSSKSSSSSSKLGTEIEDVEQFYQSLSFFDVQDLLYTVFPSYEVGGEQSYLTQPMCTPSVVKSSLITKDNTSMTNNNATKEDDDSKYATISTVENAQDKADEFSSLIAKSIRKDAEIRSISTLPELSASSALSSTSSLNAEITEMADVVDESDQSAFNDEYRDGLNFDDETDDLEEDSPKTSTSTATEAESNVIFMDMTSVMERISETTTRISRSILATQLDNVTTPLDPTLLQNTTSEEILSKVFPQGPFSRFPVMPGTPAYLWPLIPDQLLQGVAENTRKSTEYHPNPTLSDVVDLLNRHEDTLREFLSFPRTTHELCTFVMLLSPAFFSLLNPKELSNMENAYTGLGVRTIAVAESEVLSQTESTLDVSHTISSSPMLAREVCDINSLPAHTVQAAMRVFDTPASLLFRALRMFVPCHEEIMASLYDGIAPFARFKQSKTYGKPWSPMYCHYSLLPSTPHGKPTKESTNGAASATADPLQEFLGTGPACVCFCPAKLPHADQQLPAGKGDWCSSSDLELKEYVRLRRQESKLSGDAMLLSKQTRHHLFVPVLCEAETCRSLHGCLVYTRIPQERVPMPIHPLLGREFVTQALRDANILAPKPAENTKQFRTQLDRNLDATLGGFGFGLLETTMATMAMEETNYANSTMTATTIRSHVGGLGLESQTGLSQTANAGYLYDDTIADEEDDLDFLRDALGDDNDEENANRSTENISTSTNAFVDSLASPSDFNTTNSFSESSTSFANSNVTTGGGPSDDFPGRRNKKGKLTVPVYNLEDVCPSLQIGDELIYGLGQLAMEDEWTVMLEDEEEWIQLYH